VANASVRPTSVSPSTVSSSTAGDWTPYGSVTPAGGIDLLRQSVQWNTEEQIRQAKLTQMRTGGGTAGGGSSASRASAGTIGGLFGIAQAMRQKSAMEDLAKQYTSGYGALAGQAKERYQEMFDLLGRTTDQREIDLRKDYLGRESDIGQNLARLGMANTTVSPTMGLGIEREQQASLNRLADLMQGTKLGLMQQQSGELGGLGEAGLRGKLGVQQLVAMMPG